MLNRAKTQGIAIVVVLLSAVVFMGIIVAITTTLTISSRSTTADQRVALEAQYASESGIARITAEAQSGVLRTWSQLMFRMQTSFTTSVADVQNFARLFCNSSTTITPTATPTGTTAVEYCPANNATTNLTNRYAVFSQLIPLSAYNDATNPITPAPTAVPANVAAAETYWQDAFSNGSLNANTARYTNVLRGNVRYDVNFGLIATRVLYNAQNEYFFEFRLRDSTSRGVYNAGGNTVSTRTTTRSFNNNVYRIRLQPPSFAAFLSFTDQQVVSGAGGNNVNVYFNGSTLLDGPVFTNGAFYFTGNPWLSNTVGSAGCTNGYTAANVCVGTPGTAFQNNGSGPVAVTVTGTGNATSAAFSGYAVGAPNSNAAPEFVNGNFTDSTRTTYTPNPRPNPWNYTGSYGQRVVPFPTNIAPQRAAAIAGGIYIPTASNPTAGQFYNSPPPSVVMQATTTGRTTSTAFNTVANNGTAATGQLIRVLAKQQITRCPAIPTSIAISPLNPVINTTGTQTFTAIATGQTTPSFEFAPITQDETYSIVSLPSGVTGTLDPNTGVFTSTAGATPTGQFVVVRATHASGISTGTPPNSADAQLTINGVPPAIGNVGGGGTVRYKSSGANAQSTITWPNPSAGTPPFTYELLTSANTSFTSPTTQSVSGNSTVVSVNTGVLGAPTYYKVRVTGPTAPAATTPNFATVSVQAIAPAVTINGFTSPDANYNSGSRTFTYVGGTINFSWTVNNTTTINNNSGVGDGPFTYPTVQFQKNGGTWTNVPAANISGASVVNFPVTTNTTSSNDTYRFRIAARATDTGLTGSTINSNTITVASPISPVTTLNAPSPANLPFGGGASTLTWNVTNTSANTPGPFTYKVQDAATNTDVSPVLTTPTFTVNPTVTTTYRVVTTDTTTGRANIPSTNTVTVTTAPLDLPEILSFTADNNPVGVGASTPLRWSVKNAANIIVERIAPTNSVLSNLNYTPNGSTVTNSVSSNTVLPPFSDYRLTATNVVGSVSRIIRVFVGAAGAGLPTPPTNVTFSANPTVVYYPDWNSTLSWGATNATSATIDQGIGAVTPAGGGSRNVSPTTTTTYTYTASNAGGSVSRTATVTVIPPANPTVSVTATNPTASPAANQFNFTGGTANIAWSVTNQSAGGSSSGSGTGPYTYTVYESVNGTENPSPIYTGSNTSMTRSLPANGSAADVTRTYRVVAANTATNLNGQATSGSLTVLQAQVPQVALSASPTGPFNFSSGTTTLSSSGVSNTAAAGSGPYTYTLRTESSPGSGTFDVVVSTSSTPPSVPQTITNTTNAAITRRYQLTATNTNTNRSGQSSIVAVTVNGPQTPDITAISASPTTITNRSGGTSTISWTVDTSTTRPISSMTLTGPNGVNINVPYVAGQANYSRNVTINTPGYGNKVYTVTANGLGGTDSASATVSFRPPEVVTGLNTSGSALSRFDDAGAVNPGWRVTPVWSTDRGGGTPTFNSSDFSVSVVPSNEAVTATISNTGDISLNVSALPGSAGAQRDYTVRVTFSKNGDTVGPVEFTITVVKRSGSGSSLRPHARLTQTCAYGSPQSYSWPVFLEYYLEEVNGVTMQYTRTYGSTVYNDWVAPATTNAPWTTSGNASGTFNGIVYVDGGLSVRGPARTSASDPNTAAPAVANFAAVTLATDGQVTILSDLKYEDPVCTTAPVRANNGVVTPANCERNQNNWSRNVLGIYTNSNNGISIKTTAPNTTIQAISMASNSRIEVQDVPEDPVTPGCPAALQPGNNLGSINIQGGLIQRQYGQFGRLDNTATNITCGYGRTMTYDIRMQNPAYQPPFFPLADNQQWSVAFFNGENIIEPTTINGNTVFNFPAGFTSSKGN
jgi:hypothetical protein